jgi:hypothetical protein
MLRFFFSQDPFSQATKGLAKGSLITGLFLIGFGMLVFILRDIFAFLAAAIFFMAGFSAIGYAIRLYLAMRKLRGPGQKEDNAYRENVRVRNEEHNL